MLVEHHYERRLEGVRGVEIWDDGVVGCFSQFFIKPLMLDHPGPNRIYR